ncbi:hypothetical protein [Salsuginibacillus kocurii]|uniref:hypothetical protein n=1 Tax=Salsuginibacillus kocurii TaxID=427078 RepID=UPI00039F116E|nr:hypothetical protein [Salsuginibacillus kocurii]
MPEGTFGSNFALSEGINVFYFQPEEEGMIGFNLEEGEADEELQAELPDELFQELWSVVAVFEDIHGTGNLSELDMETVRMFSGSTLDSDVSGSFEADPDKGYFVAVLDENGMMNPANVNLTPYEMNVEPIDAERSTGASLEQQDDGSYYVEDYIPLGLESGTEHEFTVSEASDVTMELEVPSGMDGSLTVYDENSQVVGEADHYLEGDNETLSLSLEAGTYTIEVGDFFGHSVLEPYKLTVQ